MCRVSPGWTDLKCDLLPVSLYAPNSSCHCLPRCMTPSPTLRLFYFVFFIFIQFLFFFIKLFSFTFQLPTSSPSPWCTPALFANPPHTFLFLLLFARLSFVWLCWRMCEALKVYFSPPPFCSPLFLLVFHDTDIKSLAICLGERNGFLRWKEFLAPALPLRLGRI